MSSSSNHDRLNLPGYTLATRLGAGGYGEVWLAHAPGGLTKAVKFIFGSYNDKRAEHELRALQRIKEVRHPFLLSLERIEVIDGRLVIVTELAEKSLKDRFDECQRQGLPGIPRPELLHYLRDAADALDFLTQKHSLQHLDVKPENLLLVAGHVKVGDFGLVKDVSKTQVSLVGGLTPLYSAPEVFQGNPGSRSDQYALAVLYQEMLTGVLPFAGLTAAELTLQHVHDEPDLSPLAGSDRYILARALAKDPDQRFDSCSELIQALTSGAAEAGAWARPDRAAPGGETDEGSTSLARALPVAKPGRATQCFDSLLEDQKAPSISSLIEVEPSAEAEPIARGPLEIETADFAAQPTLFIGVGGVAGAVLKQLRQRMVKRFGDEQPPAVQFLLVDSDPKTIGRALQGDLRTALTPEETLALTLRRPQDYREQSGQLTRWLSRRWLYNIPRSLRTEGMRPLGRLAFADHARQAIQRIRLALSHSVDAENVRQSYERTGIPFSQSVPRVYVVASISGGAGSGMSLDFAHATRVALEKMGATAAQVIGVFLHTTGGDACHCDLAKVNAFAWLTEYNHFHRPGTQQVGDDSCGLPPLRSGQRAMNCAYLVELGVIGEDNDDQLNTASRPVAEYLYLDALTPAQRFFDQCRADDAETAAGVAALRTFAVEKLAATNEQAIDAAASDLRRQVVERWVGADNLSPLHAAATSVAPSIDDDAAMIDQLQIHLESLANHCRTIVAAQFGGDPHVFLQDLLAPNAAGKSLTIGEGCALLDRLFAHPQEAKATAYVLQRPVDELTSPLVMQLSGDMSRWVLEKLDNRHHRLPAAQRAAECLHERLQQIESDSARMAAALQKRLVEFSQEIYRDSRASVVRKEVRSRALLYFRVRIDFTALSAAASIARCLLAELRTLDATLGEFGRQLKYLAANLTQRPAVTYGDESSDAIGGDPLRLALSRQGEALVESIDAQLQQEFIEPQGGLFQAIRGQARVRAQLIASLERLSRRAAESLAAQPDVMHAAFAAIDGTLSATAGETGPAPATALLAYGGVFRNLTVVPAEYDADDAMPSTHAAASSRLATAGGDVVRVCEGWALPLSQIAIELIDRRRDFADLAARVQTRNDVAWTSLLAVRAAQPIVLGQLAEGVSPVSTTSFVV